MCQFKHLDGCVAAVFLHFVLKIHKKQGSGDWVFWSGRVPMVMDETSGRRALRTFLQRNGGLVVAERGPSWHSARPSLTCNEGLVAAF